MTILLIANQNRAKGIVWIALPRTGSNFLSSLLHHHPLITSYYEIFHPDQFYSGYQTNVKSIISYINQKYNFSFTSADDSQLIQWIHQYPEGLIETLCYFNPEQYFSFKLFPNHLKPELITSTILQNSQLKKILVKRNLLATYISHEIALQTNRWRNFDTSQIKISLSAEKFAQWVDWAEEWYRMFAEYNYVDKEECSIINYEDIHTHQTNVAKLNYIDRFLQKIGLEFQQPYQFPPEEQIKIMSKQDCRTNLAEKIINYQDFRQQVQIKGLDRHLKHL
ncbi:sulfotransferase [Waterburya agarophytonicola K14]|uniref:Sulfotransferase n=1 Tax=Waterburya agarophytonicola KI4 TaxID=2874699 RepID=A0A964BQJ4_9CYAN|nr:sulfotransferase [Waterburya agarophytonicola]MCC0176633.1 sulfotransferase [Waterburya agarophytonicola KI4]